jgi:hypothetical protein
VNVFWGNERSCGVKVDKISVQIGMTFDLLVFEKLWALCNVALH